MPLPCKCGTGIPNEETIIPDFVSSTYIDLIDYRKAAERAINDLGQKYHGMEYMGAMAEELYRRCATALLTLNDEKHGPKMNAFTRFLKERVQRQADRYAGTPDPHAR